MVGQRPTPSIALLDDLLCAVEEEWEAVSTPANNRRQLTDVILDPQGDGSTLLRCADIYPILSEGSTCVVVLDGSEFRAEVVGLGVGEMSMRVEGCHATAVATCYLQEAVPQYLQTLIGFLREAKFGAAPDQGAGAFHELANAVAQSPGSRGVAEHQIKYVVGPPGSGKTIALVEEVQRLTRQGERAVVVTYTNAAADLIFSRLAGQVRPGSTLRVCRFGMTPSTVLTAESSSHENVFIADSLRDALASEVLVTTAYRALACAESRPRSFDAVLIDEASAMPVALAWVAALLANSSVSLFGDPYQLGPISQQSGVPAESALQRFQTSPFEVDGVMESLAQSANATILQDQYRLPATLARATAAPLYRNAVRPLMPQGEETSSAWGPGSLLYFDSNLVGATCKRTNTSRSNNQHAEIVIRAIRSFLEEGEIEADRLEESLLVITPYREQRRLIADLLESTQWVSRTRVEKIVTTIHRAQGSERDFVIVDTVDAPNADPGVQWDVGRLWGGVGWQSQGSRLLTTAMTRARRQALIIMRRDVTGTAGDIYDPNVRALPRLNRMLDLWGKPATI